MSQIDQIKEAVLIEQLLPAGQMGMGGSKLPCPLPGHSKDRTPSFHVFQDENRYKCFGCGKSGSVIDLQMELSGQVFAEALRTLADMAGIKLEPMTPEQEAAAAVAELRAKALAFYLDVCSERLMPNASGSNTIKGAEALAYLEARGFDQEFVRDHQIGLDDGWFVKNLAMLTKQLEELGLTHADFAFVPDEKNPGRWVPHARSRTGLCILRHKEGRSRPFFADRIVIPIFSRGKPVGLTARAVGEVDKSTPKYVHLAAPQACIFLEDRIRKDRPVYLTEGPLDALALTKAGAVGIAQFGTGGIGRAKRLGVASAVYLLLDADAAGAEATDKAAASILAQGLVPYLVALPEGIKDPGEWLLAGLNEESLHEATVAARPWPTVQAEKMDKAAPHDRNRVQVQLLEISKKLTDGPAWREVAKALKFLGMPLKTPGAQALGDKDENEGKGEIVLGHEVRDPIIPALQVVPVLDGHLVRIVTSAPTRRAKKSGTKMVEQELVLVESMPDPKAPHGRAYRLRVTQDVHLTDRERDRIPELADVQGRWRDSGGQHALDAILRGEGAVDLFWLHTELRALFARYIWMRDPRLLDLLACYVVVTYVFDLWDAVPYMHLWGMRETAKSNVANLLIELGFNAVGATNQSPPVVFRSTHACRGLRIFEEAEGLSDPKPGSSAEELRLLVNAGYKRGAKAQRIDKKGDANFIQSFDAYSPKVFASIEALEVVLASRCIKVHMVRANASDLAEHGIRDMARERGFIKKSIAALRDGCYAAAVQRIEEIAGASEYLQEGPLMAHLMGRQREMWLPILSVAMAAMADEAAQLAAKEAGDRWGLLDAEEQEQRVNATLDRLEGDPAALVPRLLALQVELERIAKAEETEASLEVSTLKLLHGAITSEDPDLLPLAQDQWGVRHGWEIKSLATQISKELEEIGFRARSGSTVMGSKRLMNLLDKVGVTKRTDRFEQRTHSKDKARGVYLDRNLLVAALARFGVTLGDEKPVLPIGTAAPAGNGA